MMQAIVQRAYGASDVLRLQDIDEPTPGPHDVLVDVHAASVNRGDWLVTTGRPYVMRAALGPRRPRVEVRGRDLSGQVETVGAAVTQFRPGDDVYVETTTGSFAEYACVPERLLALKLRIEEQADSTLRWGGHAGIVGSLLMIFTFGFTAAFVGIDISPEQALTRFPEIRAARTVENSLYLVILLLWVVHFLALYRALRRTSPTPALFGTGLSILGLAVLAAGALPHVATAPISDLYQAPGATAQDQAALVLLWHGIEALFDALLYTGLVILPVGLIALGTAMLGAPDYGTRIGGTTVALGVAGLAAATAGLVGVPAIAPVGVFALIGFHLALGWRNRRLAAATSTTARSTTHGV